MTAGPGSMGILGDIDKEVLQNSAGDMGGGKPEVASCEQWDW